MGNAAKFCNQCGAKLPPPETPIDPEELEMMERDMEETPGGKCGDTHHQIIVCVYISKKTFCPECGKRLK